MSSWGWGSKFSNLQQVGDFSIFWSKSLHVQGVILKIGYFSFFNFRLGNYNVPAGSSATSLTTIAKREFTDGWDGKGGMGWNGMGWDGWYGVSLCEYIEHVYIYLNIY